MPEHPSWRWAPPGEPVEGKTYRADGWAYHPMAPYWVDQADWDLLEAVAGHDQIVILTKEDVTHPVHGFHMTKVEHLMSPFGRHCIEEYNERMRQ